MRFGLRGAGLIVGALILTIAAGYALHAQDKNPSEYRKTEVLKKKVDTIVFIYAENRSFDGLFGTYPGRTG